MNFKIGDLIGSRYKIHRIAGGAGRSGMGTVFICHDQKQGGVLALKTYQDGFFYDKSLVEHFKRGALAWIKLEHHPYIVQAVGVFKLAEQLFLGLEYISPDDENRTTLTHHLQGTITPKQILVWGIEFCDAMEHARQRGITPHRDIKPDNIMVTREGTLKVSDFDLAGIWTDFSLPDGLNQETINSTPGLTFIKVDGGKYVVGTPPWMAPEQFEGVTSVQSDIYSFGVVLYQLASGGHMPFRPDTGEEWGTVHKNTQPVKLDSPLWPIIKRCLAKDPVDRFCGDQPADGFLVLREEIVNLWQTAMPKVPVPSPPEGKVLEAEDHNTKGASLSELGLYDLAIKEYKKALTLKPDYAACYLNVGVAMTMKGDKGNAVKAIKKALQLDPDMAEGYNNYGLICMEDGKLAEAEKAYRKAMQLKPHLIGPYQNLGILLSNNDRHDEAIDLMRKAVQREPENAGYQYSLGVSLEKAERFEEAIESFKEAVRLRPNSAVYQYGLGNGWRLNGNIDNAVDCWQQAAALDSNHVLARFNLGIAHEDAGNRSKAYGYYREAINCDPIFPDPYYNMGLILAKAQLYGEGADAFEKFVEHITPELMPHLEKAKGYVESMRKDEETVQQQMKQHPEAVYNRGNALLNLDRLDEAKKFLDHALKMRPGYPSALTAMGVYYEKLNNFVEAIKCYRSCIESDPSYPLAWNNLGWVNYQSGNLDEALKAYSQYIQKAPREQLQWIEDAKKIIADIRHRKEQGQQPPSPTTPQKQAADVSAASQINEILGLFVDGKQDEGWSKLAEAADQHDSPEMHMNMGDEYISQGKYDDALDQFFKVLELEPESVLALTRIGQVFLYKNEHEAALGQFQDLMEQFPDDPAFPYNIGNVYRAMGEYKDAIKFYEKAIKIDPQLAEAHTNMGGVLFALGKNKLAMNAFRASLKIKPDNPSAHFNLALVLEKMKFVDLAIQSYKDFLGYASEKHKEQIEQAKEGITRLGGNV